MSRDTRLTVLVAARNAAGTIGRAVRSVRDEADAIVVIDDGSTDDTGRVAREAGGPKVKVVRRTTASGEGGPLGSTRQLGLSHASTPFAAWLDADDEFTPGRIARLVASLASGADVVADATTLVDGRAGTALRDVALPAWATGAALPARLFGRNALPAIGLVGFRTSTWRALGYDETFHGAEDVDIFLRAVVARCRFGWLPEIGTRVHVYPASLSRQRTQQRASYARALGKHSYSVVRTLHVESGWPAGVAARSLASMAMFRGEPDQVLTFLDEVARIEGRATWLLMFLRGTAYLLAGDDARAQAVLEETEAGQPTPEAANNLGIALARRGRAAAARAAFARSLARRPDYADACFNLEVLAATRRTDFRVTTHPLRTWDEEIEEEVTRLAPPA